MSRTTLIKLLVAQTVLLVLAVWAGVYFARDEYLLATARHDDDDEGLAKAAAVTEEQGVPTVRLSAGAQRNVGIEVAMPEPAELGVEAAVAVQVLDAQPLIELQGRLRAARHELDVARAQAGASRAEQARVQALFDDDRNASQRALEAATAQAGGDAARERAAQAALSGLREQATAGWGTVLARELEADAGGLVARLAAGRAVLLRALVRGDEPARPSARLMLRIDGRQQPLAAQPLGAAGPAAGPESGGGRGLLFHAEAKGLLPGQRLTGQLRDADARPLAGVLVPASAIVWHAGQPWIYIRESNTPQDVYAAATPAPPAASAAPAATPRKNGKPRDDDDDDDKPRAGANAAPAAPAAAASAPAAPAARAAPSDTFQRRAVPQARRAGERWFLPGYAEDDPVVVRGAQVLLSEELKYQIRNENDD